MLLLYSKLYCAVNSTSAKLNLDPVSYCSYLRLHTVVTQAYYSSDLYLSYLPYGFRAALKMANLDSVFAHMFTDPKTEDGVSLFC